MKKTRVLIPSGALALNYDQEALERGLEMKPGIIAIDGGSTDSGPAYLGRGMSKYSRASTKTEWRGLMIAREKANVPLVIGTAGTCGSDSSVDWMLDITKEIAAELGQTIKIAVLRSSQNAQDLEQAYANGRINALPAAPSISQDTFAQCSNIVALAGAEQIQQALQTNADVIIAGRTTDTAIIAALPLMNGCDAGAVWHGAKIGECGALCASNPQSGVILVDFEDDQFTIMPLAEGAKASPHTVFAHMLYENSDPYLLYEPGGHLDVSDAVYTPVNDKYVSVRGAKWHPSDTYTVKLEGAKPAGFQCILMALLRDPHYVKNAQAWVDDIAKKAHQKIHERLALDEDEFDIQLRLIGQNASFGTLETQSTTPTEIGVLAIVTAKTSERALEIGQILNPYLLHHPLTKDEEQPTFAFPFSPAEIDRGEIYEFCLNHVLVLDDPMDAFKIEEVQIG